MSAPAEHQCRPLHINGRLLCAASDHWMQPVAGTAAPSPHLKLVSR